MLKQQGDVLFLRLRTATAAPGLRRLPANEHGLHVLALGEATGHSHTASAQSCALIDAPPEQLFTLDELLRDFESYDGKLLEVLETTTIEHQEHGALVLEPGLYAIGIVREWDYTQHENRRVAD